jgi:hypothetical protein
MIAVAAPMTGSARDKIIVGEVAPSSAWFCSVRMSRLARKMPLSRCPPAKSLRTIADCDLSLLWQIRKRQFPSAAERFKELNEIERDVRRAGRMLLFRL